MAGSGSLKRFKQWKAADFIAESEIFRLLGETRLAAGDHVRAVIRKAREARGLTLMEAAALLQCEDPGLLEEMFAAAAAVKDRIYGKRIVLFAPLYISDHCLNNCRYCGYRRENSFSRRRLSQAELAEEVKVLLRMGHKRIVLEAGEHPEECPVEYVVECIENIYKVRVDNAGILRCNVNIAATIIEDYRRLEAAGIGTYILFQETYHRHTYARMHPGGPKSDYDWHTTAHDRAMQGGIDDVGLGVLFGLFEHKFEVLALLQHARHLEESFGVGPHTVSLPRLRPARGVSLADFPFLVSDREFRKIIAVIRLAIPYTGMIISTREQAMFRDELLSLGISQISAGSCTGVGGYRSEQGETGRAEGQFSVEDRRSADEIIRSMCLRGWLPSFCTACYRQGRTGDRFMALAKAGEIHNLCQPNALLTFKEYLLDYAAPETRRAGEITLRKNLGAIRDEKLRSLTQLRLSLIESGKRDIFF